MPPARARRPYGGPGPQPAPGYYPQTPSGTAYQETHTAMGAATDIEQQLSAAFNLIPAFYTVSIDLAGADQSQQSGSVPLRPEPFICRRITWATTGDAPRLVGPANGSGSLQGRAIEVSWSDEFTQFLGSRPCLLSALFGDSQGYLDFPKPILFQGKQALTVTLRRLLWPASDATTYPPVTTRFDFSFQGLSVLPYGVNQSGTAG